MATPDKTLIVGRIGTSYGIKGWMKINSFTQPMGNILAYQPWQVLIKGQWQTLTIEAGKPHGKGIIAKLPGCDTPEDAKRYTNCDIAVQQEQLPTLDANEFYWSELEGLTVIDQSGNTLGVVEHLMETGANDVLVIKGEQQHLIPYLPGRFVMSVNLDKQQILVDWDTDFL